MPKPCHIEPFSDFAESVPRALDAVGAAGLLARQQQVLIKPNQVNASPPPITLPVEATEALVRYVQDHSAAKVVIAEGCGDRELETDEIFRIHGYHDLAAKYGIELIDLNRAPLVRLSNPDFSVFPSFMMPQVVMDSFLISAAVLKAHSLSEVTLSMKNLIGCAPPEHYQQGGSWKKSAFHARMHLAIFELNRYRRPDLAVIDASVGMSEYHLGGPTCDPPVRRIVAGNDPVAVDAAGSSLLGIDWRTVEHIRLADGVLGRAETAGS